MKSMKILKQKYPEAISVGCGGRMFQSQIACK